MAGSEEGKEKPRSAAKAFILGAVNAAHVRMKWGRSSGAAKAQLVRMCVRTYEPKMIFELAATFDLEVHPHLTTSGVV